MEFLREDLTHLFDDQGIDQSAYDNKVNFQDPITRYSSVQGLHSTIVLNGCQAGSAAASAAACVTGYVFNIKMLRRVFDPKFLLHDLRQTGPNEITTRWTMNMMLAINKYSPLRRWWDPQLVFTGTSIMAINEETGISCCSNIDSVVDNTVPSPSNHNITSIAGNHSIAKTTSSDSST